MQCMFFHTFNFFYSIISFIISYVNVTSYHVLLQFVGASMGTSELKIPEKNSTSNGQKSIPARACCVVVEYLPGGTLKQYLIKNRRKKLPYKIVIQLALDLARGFASLKCYIYITHIVWILTLFSFTD